MSKKENLGLVVFFIYVIVFCGLAYYNANNPEFRLGYSYMAILIASLIGLFIRDLMKTKSLKKTIKRIIDFL